MISISTDIVLYILIGITILLIAWIIRMEMRLTKILKGKKGSDLEETIHTLHGDIVKLNDFQNQSIGYMKNIEGRLKRSIQAAETIRFNPFKGSGSGGNQSFSSALINEKGDGVVFSSLYSREHVSVYAKPLKKFSSEFEMTAEEKEALSRAKESLNYHN